MAIQREYAHRVPQFLASRLVPTSRVDDPPADSPPSPSTGPGPDERAAPARVSD